MKIEPKIFDELKRVLVSFGDKYFVGEELNRSKLSDDLRNYDEALLGKLFQIDFIKRHFIKEVARQKLFQIEQLEEAILYNDYWDTSYTKYENRIGLASNGKFLEDSQDVVLDFPFKDGVLTASMTKENNEDGYNDAFLNEVIEKDEIDRLFDKKIFVNSKRYDKNGESVVTEFNEDNDNLIIKGNNLLALHAIKAKYAGKVKVIYIDPPYNTGNDGFNYNDKFNHSSWLTFMKNRLEIAKNFLSDDGAIFISIDANEFSYLQLLIDMIFGRDNYVNTFIKKTKVGGGSDSIHGATEHEYLLVYAKSLSHLPEFYVAHDESYLKRYKYKDDTGRYFWDTLARPGLKNPIHYDILLPDGTKTNQGWIWSKKRFLEEKEKGNIRLQQGKEGNWQVHFKQYQNLKGKRPRTILNNLGGTSVGNKELKELFGGISPFGYPKSEEYLQFIFSLCTNEGDIVLDFFMGSATTQAVAMKMNRRFIGIEQMDYINEVSVPRLQKVIAGEQGGISKDVNWQGGGSFVYTELMPKNMGYLQDIIHSKTLDELKVVYNRMLTGTDTMEPADISFRADLDKIDWLGGFNENKRLLIKILDKNGLYYNYSEIDDANVRELISDNDYLFNKQFYKGGE